MRGNPDCPKCGGHGIEEVMGRDNSVLEVECTHKESTMEEIDAKVSDNGEGDKVSIIMPPVMRQWQFVSISADDARVLAAKLTRAANLAEKNAKRDEMNF